MTNPPTRLDTVGEDAAECDVRHLSRAHAGPQLPAPRGIGIEGSTMKRLLLPLFAALLLVGLAAAPSGAKGSKAEPGQFPYGVGAQDVRQTTAMLWTQTAASRIRAFWSTDPTFTDSVSKKSVDVPATHDGTLTVKITGLTPGTTYYYYFQEPITGQTSRIGTFRTPPLLSVNEPLRFAYSGDQDGTLDPDTGLPCYNNFDSFGTITALEDPDFYVNLGDTIYSDFNCEKVDAMTLDEYRRLYKINYGYENLRNLHAATSFWTQWDDHEVRNDFSPQTVDPTLLANGRQAFIEYDGMRPPAPGLGFYRHFRWGTEAEVFILDLRSFRSIEADQMDADNDGTLDCINPSTGELDLAPTLSQSWRDFFASQVAGTGLEQPVPPECTRDLKARGRTLLGSTQRNQFLNDLAASTATWKLVFTEDPMQQFFAFPYDRWEGYRWERNLVLSAIDDANIDNVVWLATDIHAALAHTVDYNTDSPGIGNTVQGMFEYTAGPIATETFAVEINKRFGVPDCTSDCPAGKVRGFLVAINKNTCVGIHYYGYNVVTIDDATGELSIYPKTQTGLGLAGNGGSGHPYADCYDYHANPVP